MKVTCPITQRPEQVSVVPTSCGSLITGCSRFIPPEEVNCGGTCAAAIDHELEIDREHRAERLLVVYANAQHTESIARQIATLLSLDGMAADLADADQGGVPPPDDYDAVLVGIAPGFWGLPRSLTSYIADHQDALSELPSFVFLVGGAASKDLAQLADRTGWRPGGVATFARPDDAGMPDASVLRAFAHAIGDAVPATELLP